MKVALVIGGTGLIGEQLIAQLIKDDRYCKVISLVRNIPETFHAKLFNVQYNFEDPDPKAIKGTDLFCCLGTTMRSAKTKDRFYKIDHDYVLQTAGIAKMNGIENICLISSMGANSQSMIYYNRVKGIIENDISNLGFDCCTIIRPSMLLGKRKEVRLAENIGKYFMQELKFLIPKRFQAVDASNVATKMIDSLNSDLKGIHIISSEKITNNED